MPEPPMQGKPWTAPATKLPKFLVSCDAPPSSSKACPTPGGANIARSRSATAPIVKARGFVLPERVDVPGRFVVCWDGLIHPALTVGEPADLDARHPGLAAGLKKAREAAKADRFDRRRSAGASAGRAGYSGVAGVHDHRRSSSACCSGSAEPTWPRPSSPRGTTWTPGPRARDLTDYQISYLDPGHRLGGLGLRG